MSLGIAFDVSHFERFLIDDVKDSLKRWIPRILRRTARPGGPNGARGQAWPIDTGESRDRMYVTDGSAPNVLYIRNRAANKGFAYPSAVENAATIGGSGVRNYNRDAAKTVILRNLSKFRFGTGGS